MRCFSLVFSMTSHTWITTFFAFSHKKKSNKIIRRIKTPSSALKLHILENQSLANHSYIHIYTRSIYIYWKNYWKCFFAFFFFFFLFLLLLNFKGLSSIHLILLYFCLVDQRAVIKFLFILVQHHTGNSCSADYLPLTLPSPEESFLSSPFYTVQSPIL